jgi:beta-glucosidase
VNPSGKLPITIPRSVGHVPAYYNHKPSARRGYLFDAISPLFPFGFGLSYTKFAFGNPRLEKSTIEPGESAVVIVDVTNIGARPGDEVVQLYIRDIVSSVTRPVKELKAFQRVSLEPGETKSVSFDILPDRFAFWNIDMDFVVEPGDFLISVGPNSVELQSIMLTVR